MVRYPANKSHQFSEMRFIFYFLLVISASALEVRLPDDFLVAFGVGNSFGWDGGFAKKTLKTKLPNVLDLLIHSTVFVYFGPWQSFKGNLGAGRLVACLVLILLLADTDRYWH